MLYHLEIHLYEEGALEDLLTGLTSLGLDSAVVVDAQRMSRLLAFDVPIFAGMREEVGSASSYCKYISCVIDNPKILDELVHILKEAGVDFEKEGTGFMMITQIEKSAGQYE